MEHTNMRALTYVASLALALTTFVANAAEMTFKEYPKSKDRGAAYTTIYINGDIEKGDYEQFATFVNKKRNVQLVVLNSPGGSLNDGLNIGLLIRQKKMSTIVFDRCISVCGLMWLAGTDRAVSTEAKIGFHAAYRMENDKPIEDGTGNAWVGRYLTLLGFSWNAIEFLTSAAPDSVEWLNDVKAKKYGITASVLKKT
jgi:hypothetical protein